MTAFDYVAVGLFVVGLAALLTFSKMARAVFVHSLTRPFRTTYLDAEGRDITEAVRAAREEQAAADKRAGM